MKDTELTTVEYVKLAGMAILATVSLTAYFLSPWIALAAA